MSSGEGRARHDQIGLDSTVARAGAEGAGRAPISGVEATLAPGDSARTSPAGAPRPAPPDDYDGLIAVDPLHYVVGAELAKGGMGRIRAARDRRLGRPVALKELLVTSGELRARFEREARITARLQHPAIVNLIEAGTWPGGEPFYAMKLVAGQSLDKAVAARATLPERLGLLPNVIAVVDALAYAHSQSVIHRDLKPANVLVGEFGETVVIDWGLAKDLADNRPEAELPLGPYRRRAAEGETEVGAIMGTPAYMPREQAMGAPVDRRADVYALGAMLYHVLAGAPPYQGRTTADILDAVIGGPPRPLLEREPALPPELATIVSKAMAPDPGARYPSARELAEDLKRFQTGQLVGAHRYTGWQLLRRWLRRHRGALTVAGAALLVLVVLGALAIRRIVRERDRTTRARRDAEASVVELLTEQGRQELLAGHGRRAAVILGEAYALARPPGVAVRALLSAAMRSAERPSRLLLGHHDEVYWAAFAPAGDRVVSVGRDRAARVWDAHSGQPLLTLTGHEGGLEGVAFSPDGARLVTASRDQSARLWDARSGALQLKLVGHTGSVKSAAFAPDGAHVVTASADGTARLWDAESGVALATLEGHQGVVRRAAFSPDGETIVTAGEDGTIRLWNARDGASLSTVFAHQEAVTSATFDRSGTQLVSTSLDGSAVLWTVADRQLTRGRALAGHTDFVMAADFSPDGRRLVTASNDRTARLWDVASGELLDTLEGHGERVFCAQFSPDGSQIVTASLDQSVRLWDAHDAGLVQVSGMVAGVPIAFSPDGVRMVTASGAGEVALWDARTGAEQRRMVGAGPLMAVSISRDGARIAAGGSEATVQVWNAASGQLEHTLSGHSQRVVAVAFSPDGRLLVSASADHSARLWDVASGQLVRTLGHDDGVTAADFSPDGTRVATTSRDKRVRLWRLDGTLLGTFTGHAGIIMGLGFSPDGTQLVTAGGRADKTVKLWDVASGRLLLSAEGHDDGVNAACFSPDGARLASASDDGTVRLWDARTGRPLQILRGLGGAATSVAFSPDGTRVVAASWDGVTQLWDVHLETRPGATVRALLRERVPLRLLGGTLVATP